MMLSDSFGEPDQPSENLEPSALLGIDFLIDHEMERDLENQIRAGGFAISLSGGGHRATLAAVGALWAVVDRGLAPSVMQVASVSGGSVTNAIIADLGPFESFAPGSFDEATKAVVSLVTHRGMAGRLVMTCLATLIGLPALLVAIGISALGGGWPVAFLGGLLALSAGHLLAGRALDFVFRRRIASAVSVATKAGSIGATDCATKVDHVLCMTDLVLGLPVYVSNQAGGHIWRRLAQDLNSSGLPRIQTFRSDQLTLARAVRASAAFPGIPPARLDIPTDAGNPEVSQFPRRAFLADGGQWNNLGTQVLREDRCLGTLVQRDAHGVPRPRLQAISPYTSAVERIPILIVNGSASLSSTGDKRFQLPMIAQAFALLQTVRILNTNTVAPRVKAAQLAFQRRALRRHPSTLREPFEVVVDLAPVKKTARFYAGCAASGDTLACLGTTRPWGIPTLADWSELHDGGLAGVRDAEDPDFSQITLATSFLPVNTEIARSIVARSYLNTMIASLALAPLAPGDLRQVRLLSERLDAVFA